MTWNTTIINNDDNNVIWQGIYNIYRAKSGAHTLHVILYLHSIVYCGRYDYMFGNLRQ